MKRILIFFIGLMWLESAFSAVDAQQNLAPEISTWKCRNGFVRMSGEGPNGTIALYYQRPADGVYALSPMPTKKLKPMTKYKFGAWVKAKNIVPSKGIGASLYVEYSKNGKHISGSGRYPKGVTGTKDWTLVTGETITPKDFTGSSLGFYIRNGQYGEAWFAAPFLYEDKPGCYVDLIQPRMKFALLPGAHLFTFSVVTVGFTGQDLFADVTLKTEQGKQLDRQMAAIHKQRFSVKMTLPEKGDYEFHLTLTGKEIKEPLKYIISAAVPDAERTQNHVTLGLNGALLVNGKKFLPIGLFFNQMSPAFATSGHYWRQEEFDNLKNSPFNCIMPYDAMHWKRRGSHLKGLAEIRSIMDELHSQGIKVIFSLKDIGVHKGWDSLDGKNGSEEVTKYIVKSLRNHPALLAWYLNDEQPVNQFYLEKRALVSQLDPWHPTWQCQFNPQELTAAISGTDICGLDPYPVQNADSNMLPIKQLFDIVNKVFAGNSPVWGCPQLFAHNNYTKSIPYYLPTESQIRSMSLFMAILGSKGFIFYAYHDQLRPEMLARKDYSFPKRWQEICRVAQQLKDLSGHLLSERKAPATSVRKKTGDVHAASFTDDSGNTATLIAAMGPGKSEAVIAVEGKTGLKSKYGKTTSLGGGKYLFRGEGIDSDVLME